MYMPAVASESLVTGAGILKLLQLLKCRRNLGRAKDRDNCKARTIRIVE